MEEKVQGVMCTPTHNYAYQGGETGQDGVGSNCRVSFFRD